ncbi:MAG: DUF4221 family protein [Saprospiraceae bacterium]
MCSSNHSEIEIIIGDRKAFNIDSKTSYASRFFDIIEYDGRECFLLLDHNGMSIQLFDFESTALVKKINLEIGGPDGVGMPNGLVYKSIDSMYIINSNRYEVVLINRYGNVQKRINILRNTNPNENTGMFLPHTSSKAILYKKNMYTSVIPDRNPFDPSFYDGHTQLKIDLKSDSFQYFGNYPNSMRKKIWAIDPFIFYSTQNDDEILFSYSVDDYLMIYNIEEDKYDKVLAISKFSPKSFVSFNESNNGDPTQFSISTLLYGPIIWDPYRKLYYRMVQSGISPKRDDGTPNTYYDKPLSIIVLNEDKEKLGEVELPFDTFLPRAFLISKTGFYLSDMHPDNPMFDDDFTSFVKLDFE